MAVYGHFIKINLVTIIDLGSCLATPLALKPPLYAALFGFILYLSFDSSFFSLFSLSAHLSTRHDFVNLRVRLLLRGALDSLRPICPICNFNKVFFD